jgi:hypothetical protein
MGCIGFGMHVHMKRTEEKNPMCISKRKMPCKFNENSSIATTMGNICMMVGL